MTATTTETPKRGRARRVVIVVAALLVCGSAGVWLLPWLLMPEDQRRMQGVWKLVRVETRTNPNIKEGSQAVVTITGSRLAISDEPGTHLLRLEPESRAFSIYTPDATHYKFLGLTVRAPAWLASSSLHAAGSYELLDDALVLHVTDVVQAGRVGKLERKIHLKRN